MMKSAKKLLVIGKPEHTALFRMYGAVAMPVLSEEETLNSLKGVEEKITEYGMILIAAELFRGEKLLKRLKNLGIPVLPIPTHRSEGMIAYNNMEAMVNKAVGMSMDFLKK